MIVDLLTTEAETDRQLATVDRLQSAMDRPAAMQDRADSVGGPPQPGLDPETGVLLTGEGLWVLTQELRTASVQDRPVHAAFVDLNPLLAAGVTLAESVARLRALLSHRDLVVRWGLTEFLVVVLGESEAVEADLAAAIPGWTGLQSPSPDQPLESFLEQILDPGLVPAVVVRE